MTKVGRRRSVVWACFKDHPAPGKRRVLCRFCEHDTVANPARMVRHIVKYCPQADEHHKRLCREYESLSVPARRRESVGSSAAGAAGSVSTGEGPAIAARRASSDGVVVMGGVELTHAPQQQQQRHSLGGLSESSGLQAEPPVQTSFQVELAQVTQLQQHLPVNVVFNRSVAVLDVMNAHVVNPDIDIQLTCVRNNHRLESSLTQQHQPRAVSRSVQIRRSIGGSNNLTAPPPYSATALDASTAENIVEELVLALLTSDASSSSSSHQLALLENDHFKLALRHLQPEFQVPTVKLVRQSILPKLHASTRRAIDKFVRSANSLTLLCSTEIVADNRRTLRWLAVDQEGRSELLAVTPQIASEYPEEIAARIRAFIQLIPRAVAVVANQHSHQQPFMLHVCNDSFGGAQLARRLLKKSLPTSGSMPMLVGGCMMQQTLLLFRDTLESVTCVGLALDKCMEVASFIRHCKPLQRDLKAAASMDDHQQQTPQHSHQFNIQPPTPESFHSFLVCVNQVLALKSAIQRVLASYTVAGSTDLDAPFLTTSSRARAFTEATGDDMFWLLLEFTREVLAPFAYLLVLSDAGRATSSQLLLCWLLLQHTINLSALVPESDRESFNMLLVDRIRMFSDDHTFACLVLDPRVHGLSLSAHGKRKARLIIADLSAKLTPSVIANGGVNRARLVEQLLKFLNRERPFEDNDSWTMMAAMPRLFWLEYLEEMPELATVALAVLGFHSHLMPLEETWQTYVQRHRRRRQSSSIDSQEVTSDGRLSLEKNEQVTFHFRKTPTSAEDARTQSLLKYRKCLPVGSTNNGEAMLASLFADDSADEALDPSAASMTPSPTSDSVAGSSGTHEFSEDNGQDDSSGGGNQSPKKSADEAPLALRQLKFWLQRFDEQEKNLAARDDSSGTRDSREGSLPRFDAEWLDLSAECAQCVRLCVEKFVFGHAGDEEDEKLQRNCSEAEVNNVGDRRQNGAGHKVGPGAGGDDDQEGTASE